MVCTGIGKALAKRLATQGLNVVLVALDDPLLSETAAELQKNFSSIQIRKVHDLSSLCFLGPCTGCNY